MCNRTNARELFTYIRHNNHRHRNIIRFFCAVVQIYSNLIKNNHRHRKTRQFFCDDVALLTKVSKLYRQHIQHIDQLPVNRLVDADRLVERHVDDLVILDTDHDISLTVLESLDCRYSQAACKDPVVGCRDSSALEVRWKTNRTRFHEMLNNP